MNQIYANRNSQKSLSYVFAHLVEVVGGLSCLASEKSKPSVEPARYVQKAVGWWLALCGAASVRSASDLVWRKFPGVCSYCQVAPHNDDLCRQEKLASGGPDWATLQKLAASQKEPQTLSDWLLMFRQTYPVHQNEQYGPSFARLSEELGELAEAVRLFEDEPQYFLSEAADVFAWLMHIENIRETKAGTHPDEIGRTLNSGFAQSYPDYCTDCQAKPCRCPRLLKRTVGRIAKEMPVDRDSENLFLSPHERRAIFQSGL